MWFTYMSFHNSETLTDSIYLETWQIIENRNNIKWIFRTNIRGSR